MMQILFMFFKGKVEDAIKEYSKKKKLVTELKSYLQKMEEEKKFYETNKEFPPNSFYDSSK